MSRVLGFKENFCRYRWVFTGWINATFAQIAWIEFEWCVSSWLWVCWYMR